MRLADWLQVESSDPKNIAEIPAGLVSYLAVSPAAIIHRSGGKQHQASEEPELRKIHVLSKLK